MPILVRIFISIFLVYLAYAIIKSLLPKNQGEFSNFDSRTSHSIPKTSAKKKPELLGMRFPNAKMTEMEILEIKGDLNYNKIQKAFRKKLQEFHPDRFEGASPEEQKLALESTLLFTKARDNLLKRIKSN